MKLITWNCHHGSINERITHLTKFNADFIFLQEVKRPLAPDSRVRWFGTNEKKGHAIFVSENFLVSSFDEEPVDPFIVPLIIDGTFSFHILMIWTQHRSEYIKQLQEPLNKYHKFLLEKPSIIVGDFNSSAIWDKNHRSFNHSIMVTHLHDVFGLRSAYHEKMKCPQGYEPDPTLHHCYKQERPYHIDYCFLPESWQIKDVTVGKYEDWISQSDHCPLIVDVDVK